MSDVSYALFDTAFGRCGVAWRDGRIVASSLPEATPDEIERKFTQAFPGAALRDPPAPVVHAISLLQRHLSGQPVELSVIDVDLTGITPGRRAILEASRRIPAGQTLTYGELATKLGKPGAARAVGQAMATNPLPPIVPCHRLMGADRKLHGFSAYGGVKTKRRLLELEGAATDETPDAPQLALGLAPKAKAPNGR